MRVLYGVIVLLTLGLTSCQSADKNSPATAKEESIPHQVRDYLKSLYNISQDAQNIQVSSDQGTVTLKGTVATQKEKTMILNFVKALPGVKKVDDHLQVRNP